MYDFGGIWYFIYRLGGALALAIIALALGWRRAAGRRRKQLIAFALLAFVLTAPLVHFALALRAPQIEMLEGQYAGSSRSMIAARGLRRYAFDTGEFDLQTCQLDQYTAAEILPQKMQEGAWYRVWFEKRTDTIVKCEEMK